MMEYYKQVNILLNNCKLGTKTELKDNILYVNLNFTNKCQ